MSDKTAAEVRETVEWLEHDNDHTLMRDAAKDRHDLVNMLRIPDLPEHMTRGVGVAEPSPLLLWLRGQVSADILPYPTQKTVTPFGTVQSLQQQADKIEKWLSLFHVQVDEAKRQTSDTRDHQMLSPYGIMILRCGSPDEQFPWSVETPDPLTCFFPIERAPMRPRIFGRRFKQLVRDAQKAYSGKKNYKNNTWDNRADALTYKGGEWDWERLGTDRTVDGLNQNAIDGFDECEFLELHDGPMVYVYAQNQGGKDGMLVWQGKSMTGGVSAVVVPGVYSSVGPVSERMQPFFWPAMQAVNAINRIRAQRATRSEANKPDVFVERTPEQAAAFAAAGALPGVQGQQAAMDAGGPNVVNVNGRVTPWNMEPDPDLDKREQSWWTELNRYIDSITETTEPEVIKDVGVNSYLTNLESRKRQRAPMLQNLDWGWNEIFKMAIRSIGEYDKDFPLYATDDSIHVNLKKGQSETIGPKDVADFFDKFWLTTETKSTTEAEKRARIQDWAYNKGLGLATQVEGVDIAYNDRMRQVEQLFISMGVEANMDWVKASIVVATRERVKFRADIDIGDATTQPQPIAPQPLPTGTGGPGPQPMRPANVPGPAGGSGAAVA